LQNNKDLEEYECKKILLTAVKNLKGYARISGHISLWSAVAWHDRLPAPSPCEDLNASDMQEKARIYLR